MHRYRQRVTQALRERLLIPLRQLSGLEVLVAVMIGLIGGILPVPLVTSAATLAIGWYARCTAAELVVGSTVNLFCTPLQFAMLPPLARWAGFLLGKDTNGFTAAALREALHKGYGAFFVGCGRMILYALVAWVLLCSPIIVALRALQSYTVQRKGQRDSLRTYVMEDVRICDDE